MNPRLRHEDGGTLAWGEIKKCQNKPLILRARPHGIDGVGRCEASGSPPGFANAPAFAPRDCEGSCRSGQGQRSGKRLERVAGGCVEEERHHSIGIKVPCAASIEADGFFSRAALVSRMEPWSAASMQVPAKTHPVMNETNPGRWSKSSSKVPSKVPSNGPSNGPSKEPGATIRWRIAARVQA